MKWHGTQAEAFDYQEAARQHCNCAFSDIGARVSVCSVHQMFDEQRTADWLLFLRYQLRSLRYVLGT